MGLWERRFGASETVIGTSVTLNDVPHEVVGVMPSDFELRMLDRATGFELWTLFRPGEPGYRPGGTGGVAILGRLHAGASIAAAQQELTAIHRDSESAYARNAADFDVLVASLQADNANCPTDAGLRGRRGGMPVAPRLHEHRHVGRAPGRAREAAIRVALGSGRLRLVRQFLAESLLMAASAVAAALGWQRLPCICSRHGIRSACCRRCRLRSTCGR